MTLNELKEPYERCLAVNKNKLNNYSCNDIVKLLLSSSSSYEKDIYISYLVCKSWNLLQKIYYVNNNANLSSEECYDIFTQTLHYVIKSHVWDNSESTLYKDKDAFMKAMAITIQCRKKNFINAKFKQKRILNNNILSLDSLYEDFNEGYFTNFIEEYYNLNDYLIDKQIVYYFKRKYYLASFILEGIIYYNIYDKSNNLDIRKLRKYLRNIDDDFCKYFSSKYNLSLEEVKNSLKYFKENPQDKLDKKIKLSFMYLRHNDTIKQILNI